MFPLRRLRPSPGFRSNVNAIVVASNKNADVQRGNSAQCFVSFWNDNDRLENSGRSYSTAAFFSQSQSSRTLHQPCRIENSTSVLTRLDFRHHHYENKMLFSTDTTTEDNGTQNDDDANENDNDNAIASPPDSQPKRLEILELLQGDTTTNQKNTKGGTDRAFRLLQEMMRQYDVTTTKEGEKPDNELYEALLESLLSHSSDHKTTALQAQTIVTEMEQLYQSSEKKDPDLRPSTVCHSHLIQAWSQASSPDQAERVFWEMLQPQNFPPSPETSTSTSKLPTKALRSHLGQC